MHVTGDSQVGLAPLGGTPASGYHNLLTGVPGEDASRVAVLMDLPVEGSPMHRVLGTTAGGRYGLAVGP